MGLRTKIIYETNDYCSILNITKAILGATSKIRYHKNIECVNQKKEEICKSMKDLFENSYVLPNPQYTHVTSILENSIMNILECDKVNISKFKQNITYFNYEIVPFIIFVILINYVFLKKIKKQ